MIPLAERFQRPSSDRSRALLAAVVLVLGAGVALAVGQPGDLGDDGDDRSAVGATSTTSVDVPDDDGPTATTATTDPSPSTTVGGDPDGQPGSTPPPGSGLGADGAGSAGGDGQLADTGGPPLALPGALVLAGVLTRRLWAR